MSHHEAHDLRRRARRLRRLAERIEASEFMSLGRHAGDDTWRGRRPLFCRNLLHRDQARLRDEVDGLRWQGYLLDQRADRLDRAAALQSGRVS